jgi:hypothetical protein
MNARAIKTSQWQTSPDVISLSNQGSVESLESVEQKHILIYVI